MLLVYNYVLLKMSTWYSKHVEESNSILRINNIQCITLVIIVWSEIRVWRHKHSTRRWIKEFLSTSYKILQDYPDWGFSVLFLSCKANARVKLAKSGHGPHLFRIIVFCVVLVIVLCYRLYTVLLLLCCTVIVLLCYYLYCPMYWLCVLYHCHRVLIQLQLTNISYNLLLLSCSLATRPAYRSVLCISTIIELCGKCKEPLLM